MRPSSPDPIRSVVGGLPVAALLVAITTALTPQRAEAQCLTCDSGEAACVDYLVGANFCMEGSYKSNGIWFDWCFTWGGMCEWIMQLDFAEDGTAYASREPALSTDEEALLRPEHASALEQTCDGVLLAVRGTRGARDDTRSSEDPLHLTL